MNEKGKSKAWLFLCICLAVILVSSFFASALQSAWWKVDVYDLRNEVNSGVWDQDATVPVNGSVVSGILFVPPNASASTPQPGIVLTHGYLNNRELQLQNAIELARRGFVVLTIDRESHGNYPNAGNASLFARGLYDATKYLYNLDYVDRERIGISGHSMGGCDTAGVLMEDAANASELSMSMLGAFLGDMGQELTPAGGYALEIVSAGLMQGWDNFAGAGEGVSVGILKANDDEFFFGSSSWANGGNTLADGSTARSRDYLQSVYGAVFVGIDPAAGAINIQNDGVYLDGQLQNVTPGQAATPGFRVIYENDEVHPENHFSTKSAADVVSFFYTAFGTPAGENYIAAGNQTWWIKEAFSCIALLAFFAMLIPLADLFLRVPLFKSLRGEVSNESLPALKGVRKNLSYWLTGIACTLFSGFIIVKFTTEWGDAWFPNTQLYPQDTTNWVAMWAIGCGLFALAINLIVWGVNAVINKRKAAEGEYIGPVESGKIGGGLGALVKTGLLAVILVTCVYAVLYIIWAIFKVDFRIWSFDIKVFDIPKMLPTMLRYTCFFAIFYCINSILNQNYRLKNLPEWATIAINAFFNVAGIFLVMMIQYGTFQSTGILWQPEMNLGYIVLFPIIPVLIIATIISRKLYLKTGNAWLGGFVNALVFTAITVANTAASFPYVMG